MDVLEKGLDSIERIVKKYRENPGHKLPVRPRGGGTGI
jgi:hypothetical protein